MSAQAGALRLGETLLGPAALPPPPTRHALLALIIALAALIHLGMVPWGDLYSHTEGQYASAAREMVQTDQYVFPTHSSIPPLPMRPLLCWLIVASYKIFGVSAAAARLPLAFSVIATTALTFLLGERLANFWRGFIAASIYLTLSGTFLFGRLITSEPLFSALLTGAIYCALAGLQERNRRRLWYAAFWLCAALACLAEGAEGLLLPIAAFGLLAIFYREVRLRLPALFWWPYLLLSLFVLVPWYFLAERQVHGLFQSPSFAEWGKYLLGQNASGRGFDDVPRYRFLLLHLAWWFPWSIAIAPALLLSWRRVMRPREITLGDALPFSWMGVVLASVLVMGQRQDYYGFCVFPAFALWAAASWERASGRWLIAGCVLLGGIGVVIGVGAGVLPRLLPAHEQTWRTMANRFTAWEALCSMPVSNWLSFRPLLALIAVALVGGAAITAYLVHIRREKLAVIGLTLAMIPIGLSLISGITRVAPYFSLAEAARFLNSHLGPNGEVLFEGSPGLGSSLRFYLDRPFVLVNQQLDSRLPLTSAQRKRFLAEPAALEELAAPRPVFLVIEQDRLRYWREMLTRRFHVYHQVASCGTHLVLSNQF